VTLTCRGFWDAKVGNSPEEYEDACWPEDGGRGAGAGLFAVADGATESSYSRDWARLLAVAYCAGATGPGRLVRRLPALQAEWTGAHAQSGLPWYAAEKVAMGSFAALLGVRVTATPGGASLHALAAGDCTLALVREGDLRLAWPVERAADFGSNPALLSSIGDAEGQRPLLQTRDVALLAGDVVYLMTDGIGSWFLAEAEAGRSPWAELGRFGAADQDGFATWARGLRSSGAMHNDDVTVLILEVGSLVAR
jgi:hypothetical protein